MSTEMTKGSCAFCDRLLSKSGMTRHLQSCGQRAKAMRDEKGSGRLYHLVVEGRDAPQYWMHIEAPGIATLDEVDQFLRAIWLECCGHLSAFYIDGVEYSPVDELDFYDDPLFGPVAESADIELYRVIRPGSKFTYEYDFGSTTRLRLRVQSERRAAIHDRPVALLARNEPPEYACDECGRLAVEICTECIWDGTGLLCRDCAQTHECDEYLRLPVVNSPRTGVCGYTGGVIIEI